MKKFLLIYIALTLSFAAIAQTQQGYVKTKGRMVNGQLVPGQGLKGATVSVHGRTSVLVNSDDGAFSFPSPESQFRLDSVKKKGYQLVDMDVCPRTYRYSGNPLYIVMETPEQQLQDKLTAERKIRRHLQKQLQEREDEIEALKEQQQISDEEYRQALQKLYADLESNEQLISDMAKRYSELDYDQLDEFYRQVSYCIENGELVKADSLLKTKGDVTQQVEEQLRKGQAIKEQEEQLEQAKTVYSADMDELAKRCYSYYETFKAQHLNDTAAYYLELRANLDTTNVDWQLEAGYFILQYVKDFDQTLMLFNRALASAETRFGKDSNITGSVLQGIGEVYIETGDYESAFEMYNKALQIFRLNSENEETKEFIRSYNLLGIYYYNVGDIDKAKAYTLKEIEISKRLHGEHYRELSTSYENLSAIYDDAGINDSAVFYGEKARDIEFAAAGGESADMASVLYNLGMVYKHYAMMDNDEEYIEKSAAAYQEALRIAIMHFGENSSIVADIYHSISALYDYLEDYENAIVYAEKDLEISKAIYGDHHPLVAESYNGMGLTYYYLGDYDKASMCYYKALSILKDYIDNDQTSRYEVYVNLGVLKHKQHEYDSAVYYYSSFINAYEKIYGQHRDIALVYRKLAGVYIDQNDYPEAINCLTKAVNMEKAMGGSNKAYLANYYYNIGALYIRMEQYDKALPNMQESLRIFTEIGDRGGVDDSIKKIEEAEAKLKGQVNEPKNE